jgi:Holliday junction resolvasome RuvABC endonuclease subunit
MILALDIATKTGWKTKNASGTWDLKPNRGESDGMRILRFRAKVAEICELEQIKVIAYERPAGMHKASIMVASELVGALKVLAIEKGIEVACYSATEIKKDATGKGNSGKPEMIQAAIDLGYNPKDDNEADAIHLYHLACKDLGINDNPKQNSSGQA